MLGKKHLHIDDDDFVIDLLVRSMTSAVGGTINVDIGNEPAMRIDIDRDNRINVDLLQPKLFRTPEDETGAV
ncbi:MAG: hypothetical protein JO297_18075 [Nitrososphaeraceae archaeon]|nr:hypothetical protein [Nitrososphaeraceae archaeon]